MHIKALTGHFTEHKKVVSEGLLQKIKSLFYNKEYGPLSAPSWAMNGPLVPVFPPTAIVTARLGSPRLSHLSFNVEDPLSHHHRYTNSKEGRIFFTTVVVLVVERSLACAKWS